MSNPEIPAQSPLQSRSWPVLARTVQGLAILFIVGMFIASIPINYQHRQQICAAEPCPPGELTQASVQALRRIGLSVDGLVRWTIGLDILIAGVYTACAVIILIRKPAERISILATIMLVSFGVATFTGELNGLVYLRPQLELLVRLIALVGNCSIVAFLFLFPSGRFIPRWASALLAGWIVFQLPRYFFPESVFNLQNSTPLLYNVLFIGGILSGVIAQIYRYRRVSDSTGRQQTKWVVYGFSFSVGGYAVVRLLEMLLTDPLGTQVAAALGLSILSTACMLLLPLSIALALLRYRLWDIDPIINRTLVYGLLSLSTMALYLTIVILLSNYFQNRLANFLVAFVATGMIAILFEPLRERLQRAVNRLMYGERDDPATVLARLSQRLEASLASETVLQTIVETIGQTLRLPYTAIALDLPEDGQGQAGGARIAAEYGVPAEQTIFFPLNYQSQRVGELALAPRAAGEALSMADMRLLNVIAQQAGTAAHTVLLTQALRQLNLDLQQSRQRLVTAQEEERRRLRRDLHDGVGPTLASLSQRLDSAADLVESSPQASVAMLIGLKAQVKGVLAEIRRLVYNLRPPVLDEFGLVTAIREHIAPYISPNGLMVTLNAPDPMPVVSAAVEVAAYRIVLEAFTNVIQHAQARSCQIDIELNDEWLTLRVADDGQGFSSRTHSGVGLASMRERAAELGGECLIESTPGGGTRLRAVLPLIKE